MTVIAPQNTGPVYYFGGGLRFDAPAGGEPTGFIDNGSDVLTGNVGNNIMVGDLLGTGSFNTEGDTLYGNAGNDIMYGDTGPYGTYADASWANRTIGSTDYLYGDAASTRSLAVPAATGSTVGRIMTGCIRASATECWKETLVRTFFTAAAETTRCMAVPASTRSTATAATTFSPVKVTIQIVAAF